MARLSLLIIICVSVLASASCRRAVPMPKDPQVTADPYEVIEALEALRVKLDFDGVYHITRAGFVGTDIKDNDLKLLIGLKHIDQLNLIGTNITDRGLRYLGQVKGVRYMFLDKTNITQEGVWQLEQDIPETTLITAYWDRGEADPKEPPKVHEYAEDLKDQSKPLHVHPMTIERIDEPEDEEAPKVPADDALPKDGEKKPADGSKQPTEDKDDVRPGKKDDVKPAAADNAAKPETSENGAGDDTASSGEEEEPATDAKPESPAKGNASEAPSDE